MRTSPLSEAVSPVVVLGATSSRFGEVEGPITAAVLDLLNMRLAQQAALESKYTNAVTVLASAHKAQMTELGQRLEKELLQILEESKW